MSCVKIVSLILLAIYLIFVGLIDLIGLQVHPVINFLLGLVAAVSGVLILLSSHEYWHHHEEEGYWGHHE